MTVKVLHTSVLLARLLVPDFFMTSSIQALLHFLQACLTAILVSRLFPVYGARPSRLGTANRKGPGEKAKLVGETFYVFVIEKQITREN